LPAGITLKKLYLVIILVAFALAVAAYVIFATEPNVYASKGKFSYYLSTTSNPTNNLPYTSEVFSKSIADSIQTRLFIERLYKAANIDISSERLQKPSDFISTSVVTGSNIIQVTLFNKSKDNLSKLNQKFVTVLNESALISGTVPRPFINIVDPLYIEQKAAYPRPLQYSALVFIGSLLVGIMIIYIFTNEG
jgi:capsular polysaccharide biosynthesis protein